MNRKIGLLYDPSSRGLQELSNLFCSLSPFEHLNDELEEVLSEEEFAVDQKETR